MLEPKMDVLFATSRDAPNEIATPIIAAVAAAELTTKTVDLGRLGATSSRLGRVVQAIIGEAEAGRLLRELTSERPRVAVAFDPGALAALVLARDRNVSRTAVIAVVPSLAPGRAWAVDADRYVVIDDEAAVALADHGVDGARIVVTGPIVPRALFEAAARPRAELRKEFGFPDPPPVVLVDTRGIELEQLGQLTLQLSLVGRPIYILFDAAGNADTAAQLRRQVPALGIKGKLFGDTPNAPKLWRTADIVIGKMTTRALHATLAIDAAFVVLEPDGASHEAEVRALVERRLGGAASKMLLVASALDSVLGRRARGDRPRDGASETAELVTLVAAHHEAVLDETIAARANAAAETAAAADPAGELEDLSGFDDFGDSSQPEPRPEVNLKQARLQQELDDARSEAEKWEQRRALAEKNGDRALAEQAAREADRKRARMHEALEALARLAAEPPRPPPEDPLAALRRRAAAAPTLPKSLDDELAALKNRVEAEKRRR